MIAQALRAWRSSAGLGTLEVAPGAAWENGYAESFDRKVRDELLEAEEFGRVLEAKVLAQGCRQEPSLSGLPRRWGIGRRRSSRRWLLGPTRPRRVGPRSHP